MALHVQHHPFSNVGGSFYIREDNEDILHHITLIVASVEGNRATTTRSRWFPPIYRSKFSDKPLCDDIVKMFLNMIEIPQIFFIGRDCTMVENLSRMLRTETLLQPHHQHRENYLSILFVMLEGCCWYQIVRSSPSPSPSPSFLDEEIMMNDFLQLVCDSGESSFPAGASAIQRLTILDEDDDNCAICLQELVTGSDAAMLPCSHVYHHTCIMKWFVQCGTCPMCRYHCR